MTKIIEVSYNDLIKSCRNLYQDGEITLQQYATCIRRYKDMNDQNGGVF